MRPNFSFSLFLLILLSQIDVKSQTSDPNRKEFPLVADSNLIRSDWNDARYNLFLKAVDAFKNNNFEKAIKSFNSILEIGPDDPAAIYDRGLCYYKMQNRNLACIDFKYAAYYGVQYAISNCKYFCDSSLDVNAFMDSGLVYNSLAKSQVRPDAPPVFPGGNDSLYSFIIKNLGPEFIRNKLNADRVILKFTIDEKGTASNPSFINENKTYSKDVLQVFSIMPNWKPASQNGVNIKCIYLFPFVDKNAFNRVNNRFYNKGVLFLNDGKLNESISCFNSVLNYNDNDFDAYYNRGICYYKMNDLSNACNNWSQAFLINANEKSTNIINKLCDSSIVYKGEKQKISSFMSNPSNLVYTVVEEMPRFPGGDQKLFEYLSLMRYPAKAREQGISGRVYVTFVIDENGIIKDPKVLRGIGGGCDEEALRIVKLMPAWIPGRQNGKKVCVQYNLPMNFNLK